MTNPTSYQHLLELAHRRAIDGRAGLAASVAEMCLAAKTELTERELTLTFEILRQLVDKVEIQVRRHIADYLADRNDVPRDLLVFLANDEITVAYPILLHSGLLDDEDLISIIAHRTRRHQSTIAMRPYLSERVSAKLIETDNVDVITTLLCNKSARIDEEKMEYLANRSLRIEQYREPLLTRDDLPPALARRMYAWVGLTLRNYITEHFEVDAAVLDRSLSDALAENLQDEIFRGDQAIDLAQYASPAHQQPEVGLRRSLEKGDLIQFMSRLVEMTGLPASAIEAVVADKGRHSLAIACKACGIDRDNFSALLALLEGLDGAIFQEGERLERALLYFDRIDAGGARNVLESWRRSPPGRWDG